ncbi:hypothetical protein HaLaN_09740 [Haematococcus lacustris]|uniref:Uncharacterized protein n=1 Tax=Haematococcus lacustris TaxID=44745 RepID=A0A699YUF9_HAELA|nr:hypothetical protein HaLaN_09740 [Haematococcus lacustris]
MSTRRRSEAKLSGWSREVLRSRELRSPEFTAKSRWAPLSRVGIRNTAAFGIVAPEVLSKALRCEARAQADDRCEETKCYSAAARSGCMAGCALNSGCSRQRHVAAVADYVLVDSFRLAWQCFVLTSSRRWHQ